MIVKQVSVFLENKPGRLERITSVLKDAGINIRAMTLSTSSAGWGILNLLVDRPQEAAEVLKGTGHPAALRDIIIHNPLLPKSTPEKSRVVDIGILNIVASPF